jgi:Skp family chaperone for outer membrane proteins
MTTINSKGVLRMKKHLLTSAILAAVISQGVLVDRSVAQAPVARPADPGVRVIDVTRIFKNYSGFQAQVQNMKKQVEATEARLQGQVESVKKKAEGLKTLKHGTPAYQKLEAEIAQLRADFNVQAQIQKKQFLEKESEIYYKTYQQVKDLVRLYCQNNGISLVLRFNTEQTGDQSTRPDRLRAMNRPVVYEQGIDITGVILSELERRAKLAGRPAAAPR